MIEIPASLTIINPTAPYIQRSQTVVHSAAGDMRVFSRAGDRWVGSFGLKPIRAGDAAMQDLINFLLDLENSAETFNYYIKGLPPLGDASERIDYVGMPVVVGRDFIRLDAQNRIETVTELPGRFVSVANRLYRITATSAARITVDRPITIAAAMTADNLFNPNVEVRALSVQPPTFNSSNGIYSGAVIEWQAVR